MTMTSQSAGSKRKSIYRASYWNAFIGHVHRLVSLGYQRIISTLGLAALRDKEEPAITGHLVQAMKDMRHQAGLPCPYFDIDDNPPLNDGGKEGKDREEIDIQITWLNAKGPGPRFHIEAKRLYRSDSVSEYVGKEGLEAILTEYYAKGDSHAGMLGYVQEGVAHEWANKIRKKLEKNRQGYGLDPNEDCWSQRNDESNLEHSFSSHHPHCSRPITVHHTFLLCHG